MATEAAEVAGGDEKWWLVRPRATGSTWQEGRRKAKARGVEARGSGQIPGLTGFTGCWRCANLGHRAANCELVAAEAAEHWIAKQIADLGTQQAQVVVEEAIKRAQAKATVILQQREQQQQAELEEQRKQAEERRQTQRRYAGQRRVRQGWQSARRFKEKAKLAMDAVKRGEYPEPWATVAEAKAKRKEAEAQRRAAVQRQQVAKQVQRAYRQQDELWQAGQGRHEQQANRYRPQDRSSLDSAMHALHKQIAAEGAERTAVAESQRAQEQENKAKQELATQRKLQRLQAQQAQEQQKQEQFRQWQAQVQGQFDQWRTQQTQRAPAVAKAKKEPSGLARGLVPLTPDINIIIDSTSSSIIA